MGRSIYRVLVVVTAVLLATSTVGVAVQDRSVPTRETTDRVVGQAAGNVTASVSISNQTSNGTTVVIDSYQFGATGEALTIWNFTNGTPDQPIGSLTAPPNGTNVRVTLDDPINESQNLGAAIHNNSSDLSLSTVITKDVTAYVTVEQNETGADGGGNETDTTPAVVSISNQTSNGSSVVVDNYQFGSAGEALTIWNFTNGTPDQPIGSLTAPPNGTNVRVTLDDPINESQNLGAAIHNNSSDLSLSTVIAKDVTAYVTVEQNETDDGSGNETDEGDGADGNATAGPEQGPPPADIAAFRNTAPVQQTTPPSLSGKIRVESQYQSNTTIVLQNESEGNYSLAINVTGDARNVTFFLQKQAVESSQNISNATMLLDGQPHPFYVNASAGPGNSPWILFEIEHFSTRNVTFTSTSTNTTNETTAPGPVVGDTAPTDVDGDGVYEDINGDGNVTAADVTAFFNALIQNDQTIANNPSQFDINGNGDGATAADVTRLFNNLLAG